MQLWPLDVVEECRVTSRGVLYPTPDRDDHHGSPLSDLLTCLDYTSLELTVTEVKHKMMIEDESLEITDKIAFLTGQDNYIKNRIEQEMAEHGVIIPGLTFWGYHQERPGKSNGSLSDRRA
jgi:hypothetical protein